MSDAHKLKETETEFTANQVRKGLAILANNQNELSIGEWNDFSNAALTLITAAENSIALEERVKELEASDDRMRKLQLALNEIAIQNTTPEIIELYGDDDGSEYQDAYNEIIMIARQTLEANHD